MGVQEPPVRPPGSAPAQPQEVRSVAGRVLRGTAGGEQPVAGQIVVLHRIGADSAGPVDSSRTARDGRYRMSFRSEGQAMYIVAARFAGVAYFAPPLRVRDAADADIVVFDTTSRDLALALRGRHLVLSRADAATRRIVDVFEVANDSTLTRIGGRGGGGTWRIPLPPGVRNASAAPGDIPPDAVRIENDTAVVIAPIAPGVKQLVLQYELARSASALSIGIDRPVGLFEVLVEGPGITVEGGALSRQEPVALEGRTFERFTAQDLSAGSVIRISLPSSPGGMAARRAFLVLLAASVAVALGVAWGRRPLVPRAPAPVVERADADALARAIAALDAVHERQPHPGVAERVHYQRRRSELKARLVSALEEVEGPVLEEVEGGVGEK